MDFSSNEPSCTINRYLKCHPSFVNSSGCRPGKAAFCILFSFRRIHGCGCPGFDGCCRSNTALGGESSPSKDPTKFIHGPASIDNVCASTSLPLAINLISCGSFSRTQKPPYPFSSSDPPSFIESFMG